jgi:hypothetical protein
MQHRRRWIMVVALVGSFGQSGCGQPAVVEAPTSSDEAAAADPMQVTLSPEAAERLGIETTQVQKGRAGRTSVPYAAVLYDAQGDTWVYANPEQLVFVRTQIRVDRIDGDVAQLLDGPPLGTLVVTVGLAELFGAETGVGEPE